MKKRDHYHGIVHTLEKLHNSHPTYSMGKHLSTALDGYGNIELMTDKEIRDALVKYSNSLEYDVPHDDEIDTIIKDAMHLEEITEEDYGEE